MTNNQLTIDQRGVVLVFTLILMAVLLTIALGFSYLVINDINKARAIDDSIIAYYGADAGMEESLYLLRKDSIASTHPAADLKGLRSEIIQLPQSHGSWDISDSTDFERTILRQRLYSGQGVKFFVLNRAGANLTRSIGVEWYRGDETAPKLEIKLTQLSPQPTELPGGPMVYYTDTDAVELADSADNGLGPTCYELKDLDFSTGLPRSDAPVDYSVTIKVLGELDTDLVDQLIARAYDTSDCSGSVDTQGLNNLTIYAQGKYNQSEQNIIAQIVPFDPSSGLLGFVLFSQEDITKDNE
jgi:hypothetical protein